MACKYSKLEQVGDNRYEVEDEESPDKNKDQDTAEKDEKSVGVKILSLPSYYPLQDSMAEGMKAMWEMSLEVGSHANMFPYPTPPPPQQTTSQDPKKGKYK
eukprot:sb/3478456/